MIAGEHRDDRPIENGHLAALPMRHPRRQLFEAAETSCGFGQVRLARASGIGRAFVAARQIPAERSNIV
jgi:hypothetical protein